MVKVKICGITAESEVKFINKYLPDYIGFVFAEGRHKVTPKLALELAQGVSPAIKKAGVFVDMRPGQVAAIAETTGLDAVQLHGSEDGKYIRTLRLMLKPGTEIWKALRIGGGETGGRDIFNPATLASFDADRLLLDTFFPNCPGGTGMTFDWRLAVQLKRLTNLPIILAGGLRPENVQQAVATVSPYAVDTSSGVESGGVKDEYKVKAFIEAARGNAD
jgi:phosphoribosylanthranilate isomerase